MPFAFAHLLQVLLIQLDPSHDIAFQTLQRLLVLTRHTRQTLRKRLLSLLRSSVLRKTWNSCITWWRHLLVEKANVHACLNIGEQLAFRDEEVGLVYW